MKQGVKYVIGAALAAALLWIVLRGKDPVAIRAALAHASVPYLLVAGALNIGHNIFRVWRWGLLLRPVRAKISYRARMSAVIIGYLTTWTIPGRLGEVVRPALLSAKEKIPLGPCLGSVVVDRLLDGVAILGLFAVGTFVTPLHGTAADYGARIRASSVFLLISIVLVLAAFLLAGTVRTSLAAWFAARRFAVTRWIGRSALSLTEGIEALRRPLLLFPILIHSVLAWATIALGTWIGIRACGADIPFGAILFLLPPLALGVALPTPGGAGGYHAAMSLGLMHLFDVPEGVAVGAGILLHLTVTLPVIALGLMFLKIDGLSWHDLKDTVRQVGALGEAPSAAERASEVAQ